MPAIIPLNEMKLSGIWNDWSSLFYCKHFFVKITRFIVIYFYKFDFETEKTYL